jgi:hypothetical protein
LADTRAVRFRHAASARRSPFIEESPMFSALSANDRLAAIAAIIVTITGVVSLFWRWGALMLVPTLAALAVLVIIFQARLAPNAKLPMARGVLLLGLGAIAALIWVLVMFQWLGYITDNLVTIDTIQFLVGLVASIVLAFAGWRAYQADSGTSAVAPPAPPAPPPAEPPSA